MGAMTRARRSFSTVVSGSDGGEGREERKDVSSAAPMPLTLPDLHACNSRIGARSGKD